MTSTMISALVVAAAGQSAPGDLRLLRYPAIHGDTVVFTYAGDLWTSSVNGGHARRLTSHAGEELRARFSPDGKTIAFMASYDGSPDLYTMSIEGGEPKRLTFEPGAEAPLTWTPDGKIAFASATGGTMGMIPRMWLISPNGGMPEPTPILEVNQAQFTQDGNTVVYQRMNGNLQWWRNYRGGRQAFISMYDLKNNKYSELPKGREQSAFPMVVGDNVYYVSDKNLRTMNLYRYDMKSKRETQVTKFADADIRWPSTDGKNSIVFERDGFIYRLDVATNQISQIKPIVKSENLTARPALRGYGSSIGDFTLSPSGNRIAIEARGELFSVPAKSGETRNLVETPSARERQPRWSPDGKSIAFWSDSSGDNQLYIEPQMGGEATQITTVPGILPTETVWSPDGKFIAFATRSSELYIVDVATKKLTLVHKNLFADQVTFDISPDSKWIALTQATPNYLGRVALYEVETGKMTPVTDGSFADSDVAFDGTGKYLYFVSARTFSPGFGLFEFSLKVEEAARIYAMPLTKDLANPLVPTPDEEPAGAPAAAAPAPQGNTVKIDWDGLAQRAFPLPLPASNYALITGVNDGVLFAGPGGLQQFSMRSRDAQTILAQGGLVSLNAAKTKIAFSGQGGIYIQDLRPGLQPGPGRVDVSAMDAVLDPRAEWRQMFWEVWRYQRDFFYDPKMYGLDWKKIGDHYAKYVDSVAHRSDMAYVLGLLIGELETGHAYVQGFQTPIPNPVPTGLLGADYEVVNGFVQFKKIYRGLNYEEGSRAPLGEPGISVNEGDYLLAIDGKPVSGKVNPNSHLVGKVGRSVVLTVNSRATMDGARTVRVRPVVAENALRYADWVDTNRKLVEKLSGGRVGYFHVPDTSTQGAIEFIKGFYANVDKDAVVVDERFNGGGFIQPWFVDTLARRVRAQVKDRNGADWLDAVAIEGPKVMLINGYAGSGGDFFPWMFKQSKLGPLMGTRTWGGLVGIKGGIPLLDGGSVTAPEFGIYDHVNGKWIAENTGVDPDIEVDARPDLVAQGRDPQLERAVEHLLNELKKGKTAPKVPAFPRIP